jgi:hypothetical protein
LDAVKSVFEMTKLRFREPIILVTRSVKAPADDTRAVLGEYDCSSASCQRDGGPQVGTIIVGPIGDVREDDNDGAGGADCVQQAAFLVIQMRALAAMADAAVEDDGQANEG